jgi:hypothetical protein
MIVFLSVSKALNSSYSTFAAPKLLLYRVSSMQQLLDAKHMAGSDSLVGTASLEIAEQLVDPAPLSPKSATKRNTF